MFTSIEIDDELLNKALVLSGLKTKKARTMIVRLKQVQAAEAAAGAWSGEGRKDPSREIEEGRRAWEERRRLP